MATNRILLRAALRSSATSIARSHVAPTQRIATHASRTTVQPRLCLAVQRRRQSTAPPTDAFKLYDFEKITALTTTPSAAKVLIDVREPGEYATHIPTAHNMPISSSPDALFLPAHEFVDRFGFAKPAHDVEVVFYCKAGVRSRAAAELARQAGYTRVGEYRGSWMDWVKMGGKEESKE